MEHRFIIHSRRPCGSGICSKKFRESFVSLNLNRDFYCSLLLLRLETFSVRIEGPDSSYSALAILQSLDSSIQHRRSTSALMPID
ncbi:hypothetical protein LXL04_028281 [Taraxacum kok-saghyz]